MFYFYPVFFSYYNFKIQHFKSSKFTSKVGKHGMKSYPKHSLKHTFMFFSDGPAEAPVTNGNTTTVPALSDDLDIFGPMISNPLPATVMPPAQVCGKNVVLHDHPYFFFEKFRDCNFERIVSEQLLIGKCWPEVGKLSLQLLCK